MSTDSNSNDSTPVPIRIFDTTLRDGEQSPGATLNLQEKIEIARHLEAMGVDVIEAGFPISSQGDFESVHAIAQEMQKAVICGLARCVPRDIDRAGEALKGGKHTRIHVFCATSKIHREQKLNKAIEEITRISVQSIKQALQYTDNVEFSPEDGSRTELEVLVDITAAAIEAGATTINIPDTVGYAIPSEYGALIRALINKVPGAERATFSTHCHNDLGLAVANSLAGVAAGARQVECTVNGIGERAGNAALEEVVMALKVRADILPYSAGIDSVSIARASKLVSNVTGFPIQYNKAIVGKNAFAHESGIHQDGMLKNTQTYEIMTPESVGVSKTSLVLGKLSGRHAFKDKLEAMGYELGSNALEDAFKRFKDLADKKKHVFDEDIAALVDDEIARGQDRIQFVSMRVVAGTFGPQSAELELSVDGEARLGVARGDGPVDAIFNAIKSLFPHEATLVLFEVHAVTEGTDAQAGVTVRLAEDGKSVTGRGSDTDTMVAAARAYVHALNKLLVKRQKTAPEALVAMRGV